MDLTFIDTAIQAAHQVAQRWKAHTNRNAPQDPSENTVQFLTV